MTLIFLMNLGNCLEKQKRTYYYRSKALYSKQYEYIVRGMETEHMSNIHESVFLAHFAKLSKTISPNSLWTKYSMLKNTTLINIVFQVFQARLNWTILYLYAVSIHIVNKGDWRGPGDMGTMPKVTQEWSWALQWKKNDDLIVCHCVILLSLQEADQFHFLKNYYC